MSVKLDQIDTFRQLLDVSNVRHQVISQNLANVNTPGYHRLDVAFEEEFVEQLRRTDGVAPTNVQPQVHEDLTRPERADGNTVDMDHELAELTRNATLYQTWLQLTAGRLSTMRHAIDG